MRSWSDQPTTRSLHVLQHHAGNTVLPLSVTHAANSHFRSRADDFLVFGKCYTPPNQARILVATSVVKIGPHSAVNVLAATHPQFRRAGLQTHLHLMVRQLQLSCGNAAVPVPSLRLLPASRLGRSSPASPHASTNHY